MQPSRLTRIALLAALPLFAFCGASATAQPRPTYTLNAALGGSVPYAGKESFVVARLAGKTPSQNVISLSGALPAITMTRPVFNSRPQLVLNGGMALGQIGGADVVLNGYLSTGVMSTGPEEPRPLLGLAALRFLF
ncbi:hypothetical protein ACFOD4_15150 [Pseudoroseomonas globiformis]|uniref:Uncharacterized protein n=1 Tax=Teichococcus globiformis TaxID=2307229 RepID=A0ABV7G6W9_9PROT